MTAEPAWSVRIVEIRNGGTTLPKSKKKIAVRTIDNDATPHRMLLR
jgi:hypothetical protein